MNIGQNQTGSEKDKIAQKLVESWSTTGLLRKTRFLHKLASKNLIKINNNTVNADLFANEIDSMITVLNRKYEKNWDFHLEQQHDEFGDKLYFNLYLKIIYPEIEITNTRGDKHTIKDLIVIVKFKESDLFEGFSMCPEDVYGTRASLSYEEWFIGYNHSHLGTYKPNRYNQVFTLLSFCRGGETEIENTMLYINENGYSEEQFELFLYNIDTLASWESTEGVPYIYIRNIVPITESTYQASTNPTIHNIKEVFNYVTFPIERNFKYVFNDNRFKIVQNRQFDNYVKMRIFNNGIETYIKKYIIKEVGSTYFGFTSTEAGNETIDYRNEKGELPYTVIQGRRIKFKREDFTGEAPNIDNYKTHPKFLKYVAEQLEQQLYYKAIRRSAIEG